MGRHRRLALGDRPSGPHRSSPNSWTRCSNSAPSSLRTLASGPGCSPPTERRVARTPSRARDWASASRPPSRSRVTGSCSSGWSATRASTPSRAPPKAESDDSDTRSLARVVRASLHPPSTSPTTQSSGTKHVEEDLVEQGRAGDLPQRPHLDPRRSHVDQEVGDALVLGHVGIGAGQADAPCRPAAPPRSTPSGRRATTRPRPGWPGCDRAARSEPAPGSLNSWHQSNSPRRVGPTQRSVCSGVPWAMMVGSAQAATARLGRRRPASAQTWSITSCSTGPASRPHGAGQCGASSPWSASARRCSAGSSMAAMAATTGSSSGPQRSRPRGAARWSDRRRQPSRATGPSRPAAAPVPPTAGAGWSPGGGGCGRRAPR